MSIITSKQRVAVGEMSAADCCSFLGTDDKWRLGASAVNDAASQLEDKRGVTASFCGGIFCSSFVST